MTTNCEALCCLKKNIQDRIDSEQIKREHSLKWQNIYKFTRVLFGVVSIGMVSLLGFGDWSNNIKFYLSLVALAATTTATFSSDVMSAFGYEERFKKNATTVGELKRLQSTLVLDIAGRSDDNSLESIDYWKYHLELGNILSTQNGKWEKSFDNSKSK